MSFEAERPRKGPWQWITGVCPVTGVMVRGRFYKRCEVPADVYELGVLTVKENAYAVDILYPAGWSDLRCEKFWPKYMAKVEAKCLARGIPFPEAENSEEVDARGIVHYRKRRPLSFGEWCMIQGDIKPSE